ncbi:MAG TPA: SusC/RagA family TonB-linked outer membrane protein [Longimicrobiales bacterium]|nr:SusC/RagA family TonB-linked outer membrane protein [Longimicrobiales bacterium]
MSRIQRCARSLAGLVIATTLLVAGHDPGAAQSTGTIHGRVVEAGTLRPLPGVQITLVGTQRIMVTNESGEFLFPAVAAGERRVRAQNLGYATVERTVRVNSGQTARADVELAPTAISLDAVVVTALGQTAQQRSLGTAQQTVQGAVIAQAQKENFVNALQGRVAGLEVTSTSGVPGASSLITIRGVSSISGSNQPLMIIDGLPVDNKTLHTGVFASTATFENRGVDFTNRASDFSPEDIESLTVLKGPEAAALYGIDAANGAIVITTKRGKAGVGGLEYSNSIKVESPRGKPDTQQVYGPSSQGSTTFLYWGEPYPAGTRFFNNVDGFFQNALTQKHNISFSGASDDARINYRLAASTIRQEGVIPSSRYDRINVTASSQAQATSWLHTDVSIQYSTDANDQPWKGAGGPLLGLVAWPDTVDAKEWLTPAGTRRRATILSAAAETDNPYFSTAKNRNNSQTNRTNVNVGFTLRPVSWGSLKTNIGVDNYTSQLELIRHPESTLGINAGGILDKANDVTRGINTQTLLNVNRHAITNTIGISGMLGNQISDRKSTVAALSGIEFLDPNFVSINNTNKRSTKTTMAQRRLVSAFGQVMVDYRNYLYVTVTGRNDWTSTIPLGENSFFYPGVSGSFIFTDAFPSLGEFMTGKLRAGWAEVGKDAAPYAYRTALEYKLTSYGGYGYGFTGPNPNLRPEFATSYEIGTELGFLGGRLGLDATLYRKQTRDQIVNGIRGSYATGFVLFNLNGASTRNEGVELTVRGVPVQRQNFMWDVQANFTRARGEVLSLPAVLPEYYSSDTWLYGNVRNGTKPGLSTMSLTGRFYLRNARGDVLISPVTGLPLVSGDFIDAGYDRQPDFLIGLSNGFRYRRLSLDFLLDIRKGGDVFNATEHYLTARGLSKRTLDRHEPRVVKGVLQDGKENTANPTVNTIVIVPAIQTGYYVGMSEELFIEKDINWLRLRDVTLSYALPGRVLGARHASVFMTATELFLLTNYSGMDPIVNGNTAATGGSSGAGIDYGNFPMPRGFNFGIRVGF